MPYRLEKALFRLSDWAAEVRLLGCLRLVAEVYLVLAAVWWLLAWAAM